MAQSDEKQPQQGGGSREPSDRWDFSSVPPASGSLIPQLKEIPETPEERKRRRIILTISAVAAGIALVAAAIFALHLRHRARIDSAVVELEETGRADALDRALALLNGEDGEEDRAVRARLHAVAHLEHARAGAAEEAQALLSDLGDPPPAGADVAAVYLALGAGEVSAAHERATQIRPRGDHKAEGLRAQALASEAVGATPQALTLAQAALELRPQGARYAALVVRLHGRLGQHEEAAAVLEGVDESIRAAPPIVLERARMAMALGDHAQAAELGQTVSEHAEATPVEDAWARLLVARGAAQGGNAKRALELVGGDVAGRPPGDEDFVLLRGQTLLLVGAVAEATAELERLPSGITRSPLARAHVVAELALARGQTSAAADALARAPDHPRTQLLLGRAAVARGKASEARSHYEAAAKADTLRAEALAGLALLALDGGDTKGAVAAASKALTQASDDPWAVQAFARAQVAAGNAKAALEAVDKALRSRADDGRLHAVRAHVLATQEADAEARKALERATDLLPRDADLFARLGHTAQRMGDAEAAGTAFERALALRPKHASALTGMLQLAVAAEDLSRAGEVLERIDGAGVVTLDVDRARARYLVLTAAGQQGIADVRRAIVRRGPSDSDLWMALAQLQMQAGDARAANGSFGRVLREREGDPWALLGRAFAQLAMRMGAAAEKTLDEVESVGAAQGLGEDFEAATTAARARLQLLEDRPGIARNLAKKAAALDPRSAEAHMALADVEDDRKRDPTPHLRDALKARIPPPEAKGRLALQLEREDPERCALATAYWEAAPRGTYSRQIQPIVRSCR
jgi:tetratricopeptide (TPR) repeat protein